VANFWNPHGRALFLDLNYERLEVVFDSGLSIFTYTADPGTRSAEALGRVCCVGGEQDHSTLGRCVVAVVECQR
jgi:hypothetical protein